MNISFSTRNRKEFIESFENGGSSSDKETAIASLQNFHLIKKDLVKLFTSALAIACK